LFSNVLLIAYRQEADLFYMPSKYRFFHPKVQYSSAIAGGETFMFQLLRVRVKTRLLNERLSEFSVEWYIGLSLALFWCALLTFLLLQTNTTNKKIRFEWISNAAEAVWSSVTILLRTAVYHRRNSWKVIFLLLIAQSGFTMLCAVMINLLQTRLITLDTIDLMHSVEQLYNSGHAPCFEEGT
jgi:hypothetical protein